MTRNEFADDFVKGQTPADGAINERQGAAERLGDERRRNVNGPIAITFRRAGSAVMHFVGVQHKRVTGQSRTIHAAVAKSLDALECDADDIGVMSVG